MGLTMKVTIYTTPICPYCIIIKNYLRKNNISFEEIDVLKDREKGEEMAKKSKQENVPVVEVDEKIIVGYDLKKLKEALGIE